MTNDECRREGDSSFDIRHSEIRHSPLLGLDDRPARVVAAVGADDVRGLWRAALGAGLELLGLERVVRAAHAGAGIRLFAFGDAHGGEPTCFLPNETA